ncbi:MAG: diaminopimelate decarboxylase, partial [Candidatus Omnitrophica bacterium]|nr:diaminopimelate decarboxylase [Candidatus Omnitrophota bacterium]MBU1894491.1 diaminopimelate decarboxylase [Candidatus Omnitrophota bacterium]
TPFYLYSYGTIMDHFNKIKNAFNEIDPLICFSMKSNSNLNVCKALVNAGAGLDIVSGGELYKALKVGCPPEKIVYASVGKTEEEISTAIRKGILFFNVESLPELMMIDTVARRLKKRPNVALRINPDVKADTHDYITTGTKEKKFGIDFNTAEEIFDNANKYSHVVLNGIHLHIGSQITETDPFVKTIKKVLKFIDERNITIEWLNLGGGFGIVYNNEKSTTADDFAKAVIPLLKDKPLKFIFEPGRFIVGNSGILVTKVLYVKTGSTGKKFAIVDAGMNDLIRPSLYDAHHEILPLIKRERKLCKYDVVGPICESGDFFALNRDLPEILPGEYIAIMSAGAYGFVMSSNYNSRPRLAEIMVKQNEVKVIRLAETYRDLIRGEKII